MRWAVLVGGTGSNLAAILQSGFPVAVVVSHRKSAGALDIARRHGIPAEYLLPAQYPGRAEYDAALRRLLSRYEVEAIAMAGFLRWLHPETISAYPGRIVNIHPSLLPAFPGLNAVEQAYDHGVRWTGVTVHFVDEGHDSGPIIAQVPVPRHEHDRVEDLAARIHAAEHRLYPAVLKALEDGGIQWQPAAVPGERARVIWKGDQLSWSVAHY